MKKLIFIFFTLFVFNNELFAYSEPCSFEYKVRIEGPAKTNCKAGYIENSGFFRCYLSSGKCGGSTGRPWNYDNIPPEYGVCRYNELLDGIGCVQNPQNNGRKHCNELFLEDDIFHSCDPNTNQSRPEPDLELIPDPETGVISPGCKNGKIYQSSNIIGSHSDGREFITYTDRTCVNPAPESQTPSTGTGEASSKTSGSITTNSNSTQSWTGNNGNNYTYDSSKNNLSVTTPSGSNHNHSVPSDFAPGGNYIPNNKGTHSGSGGDSGSGSTGDTGSENGSENGGNTGSNNGNENGGNTGDNNNGTDEPVDTTPAATSCTDSKLTLQEKMLCEMNAGMKKLNSESNPSNSMNQLMKDLNHKSTEHNSSLDTLKANTNTTNSKLDSTNTKLETLNTTNKATNTKLDTLSTNTSSTNTKLDSLNTATNTGNSTLKDIEKATNSVKNATTSNTGVLMDIDNKLGKGDEYNSDLSDSIDNHTDFYVNITTMYNDVINSYSLLDEKIQDAKNMFRDGLTFNPIVHSVSKSNLEQCFTISFLGKDVVFDFITPFIHIRPITTLIFSLLLYYILLRISFKALSSAFRIF